MKKLIMLFVLLKISTSFAQTNIQAWYAKGQVWVVWTQTIPIPEVYEIYSSSSPFTDVTNAGLIGKIGVWDCAAGAIQDQLSDPNLNWKIPTTGLGIYSLDTNQALFVFTPHSAGSMYFAVVKRGNTAVSNGNNITPSISYSYNPTIDPITCHLQYSSVDLNGHKINLYSMWADGRQDQWNERPDFPVMANFHKNGMPSIFFISEALTLDTLGGNKIPATLWLHGSDGNANESLPSGRTSINLVPKDGILVAHNDDYAAYEGGLMITQTSFTRFIGWAKNKDAYNISNLVANGDTIVNYVQKRILWINSWLVKNYYVDSTRINLNGHSNGAIGSNALIKAYPNEFASATLFNLGLTGGFPAGAGGSAGLFGDSAANNPTVLINSNGVNTRINELFELNTNASAYRDFPVLRIFHSKNDDSGQGWSPLLVAEFIKSDSLGSGAQLFWGQREHGLDTGPAWNDHWSHGNLDTMQTILDNVSYEEAKYYNNVSFPIFCNLRNDENADDLGNGTLGTIATGGNGDDWGTWGGYHDWNTTQVIDQTTLWQCTAWLNNYKVFNADNCPDSVITASVAIHKPQSFLPSPSTLVYYWTKDSVTNTVLQSGTTTVLSNGIVKADDIDVNRFPKKTIIVFSLSPVGINELSNSIDFTVYPNPAKEKISIKIDNWLYKNPKIELINMYGQIVSAAVYKGESEYQIIDISELNDGIYFINIESDKGCRVQKIIISK